MKTIDLPLINHLEFIENKKLDVSPPLYSDTVLKAEYDSATNRKTIRVEFRMGAQVILPIERFMQVRRPEEMIRHELKEIGIQMLDLVYGPIAKELRSITNAMLEEPECYYSDKLRKKINRIYKIIDAIEAR